MVVDGSIVRVVLFSYNYNTISTPIARVFITTHNFIKTIML